MNWPAVERLFAAALETPPEGRQGLLDGDSDDTVRAEVLRLLARHEELRTGQDSFLQALDLGRAAALVDSVEPDDPEVIGRYEIIRRLGSGATGVVYLARDPSLTRQVALKVLSPHLSRDATGIRRFTEEARAASRLDNPHIVAVYEIGRSEDERLFIAMAYHEGETLRDRMARGAVAAEEAVRIALDVAEGLAAAHAEGIVHRDIKPENILLTTRGACILDFGIAKVAGETITRPGAALGTAAYMSPEQTHGAGVDHRSDLWSLGVVLYEMLTGERPFQAGGGEALIYGIRHDTPKDVTALRRDLAPAVVRVVERCLEKDPERRYQSAAAALSALSAALPPWDATDSLGSRAVAPARGTRWRWGAAIVLAIGTLVGWYVVAARGRPASSAQSAEPAVAVLPYRVAGPGLEYLHEGMVDLLSFNVEGIKGLRKIDPATLITAWRALGAAASDGAGEQNGLAVARRVQARYLITGSAVQLGEDVRLVAEVRDVERGELRGAAQVTGPIDSVSWLVDRLTLELLRLNLLPSDGEHRPVSLGQVTTTSLPALKAYLAGEREYRVAHWGAAAQQYLQAVALDSTFARALYRLEKAGGWGGAGGSRRDTRQRLAALVDRLPERDRMLIRGDLELNAMNPSDVDPVPHLGMLQQLTQRYPDDVEGWVALGEKYFHAHGLALLPTSTYRGAFARATLLNPHYGEPYLHLIDDAFFRLDSVEARRLTEEYAAVDSSRKGCSHQLAYDLVWGTTAARDRALAALDTIEPNTAWARCLPLGPMAAPPDVMARLQRMFQAVADTSSDPWSTSIAFQQLGLKVLVPRGQLALVQRALAGIERPPGATKWWADDWQIMLHLTGFPDSLAAHDAAGRLVADPYPEARFWLGLLALADRRWADAERLARMLDRQAQDFATSGDTLQGGDPLELAGLARTYAATLRAYSGLLQGDRERLGELEVLLRHFPHAGATAPKSTYLRFQIGRLLFERGQLRDAERYFLSFGPLDYCCTSQAELYLGRINEALGRPQAAAEHYRRFVIWWEHADPALRGPLEEARAALRRL